MPEFPFTPAENAEPARGLVERLTAFGENVLSIVPSGFEAYARVFHPAEKVTNTSEDWASWPRASLSWEAVAALTGRTAHRTMQWPSIRENSPAIDEYPPARIGESWVEPPAEGTLPVELARVLWPLLERHTVTRDRCFFALWEGFGGLPVLIREAPAFELPARRYHLFEAPISRLPETFYSHVLPVESGHDVFVAFDHEPGQAHPSEEELEALIAKAKEEHVEAIKDLPPQHQSANLVWPEDRSWCGHTEIDLNTTYIAGTQALVDDLLACEELEVYQVEPSDEISYAADTVNPEPVDPYGGSFRLE